MEQAWIRKDPEPETLQVSGPGFCPHLICVSFIPCLVVPRDAFSNHSKRQLPAFTDPLPELSSGSKQRITGGVDRRSAGILYGTDDKADRHNLHGNIIVDICVCIIKIMFAL